MSLYWEKTATLWPDVLFQILFIHVIVFFNSLIKAKYLSLAERSARLRRSLVNAFLSLLCASQAASSMALYTEASLA